MDKTPFADLTRLSPGDPLSLDGSSFLWRNPGITDRLLQVGAKSHKHDAHPALADPAGEALVVADATAGSIPGDTTVSVTYTLLDEDGGETLAAPIATVTTPAPIDPPALTPDAAVVYDDGGTITVGSYFYAVTLTDDAGGETTIGPAIQVDREPGGASAKIEIAGLAAIVADTPDAEGWRLYRATGGGSFRFLEAGVSDLVVDDGTLCADCDTAPPNDNTTNATNSVQVTIPGTLDVLDAEGVRVYMTVTGDFVSPALAEILAMDDVGEVLTYTSIITEEGAPPDVSTSIGGADRIDAGDLLNLRWQAPVADAAALAALDPDTNVAGDVRLVLDTLSLVAWDGAGWEPIGGGGGGGTWRAPVANAAALPGAGNTAGDARVTLDDQHIHIWSGGAWVELAGGGGGIPSLDLEFGQAVVWRDSLGNGLRLIGMDDWRDQTFAPPNGQITFDGAAGTAWQGSADYDLDGAGFLIPSPDQAGADRDSIEYEGVVNGPGMSIERAFQIVNDGWHRIGATMGQDRIGWFGFLDRDANELQIRMKAETDGPGSTAGVPDDEANYVVLASVAVVLPATPWDGVFEFRRFGTTISARIWDWTNSQEFGPVEYELVHPADYPPTWDEDRSTYGGVADWFETADAWKSDGLNVYAAIPVHAVRVQTINAVDEVGTERLLLAADGQTSPPNLGDPSYLTLDPAWEPAPASTGVFMRWTPGSYVLAGKLQKTGVAPVADDTIATIPYDNRPFKTVLAVVPTGDSLGNEQVGMIRIVGQEGDPADAGEIQWISGRSSADDAFVSLDSLQLVNT